MKYIKDQLIAVIDDTMPKDKIYFINPDNMKIILPLVRDLPWYARFILMFQRYQTSWEGDRSFKRWCGEYYYKEQLK